MIQYDGHAIIDYCDVLLPPTFFRDFNGHHITTR